MVGLFCLIFVGGTATLRVSCPGGTGDPGGGGTPPSDTAPAYIIESRVRGLLIVTRPFPAHILRAYACHGKYGLVSRDYARRLRKFC